MTYHEGDTSRIKELRRPVRSLAAKTVAGLSAALATVVLLAPGEAHALNCSTAKLPPTTKNDFKCIDKGFKLFTEETFNGNGRTCSTCHIPSESYNIFPATIKKMSKAEKDLVFATNINELENKKLVKNFGLFNIAGDPASDAEDTMQFFGKDDHPPVSRHKLPIFRSSMGIFALDLTSTPQIGAPATVPPSGPPMFFPGTPLFPDCNGGPDAAGLAIRSDQAQLGWSGDGSPGTKHPDVNKCRTHHGFFDKDANGTIRAFASGAIAQHNPKTLNRVPGVDFRRATDLELDALALFQRWLGRRKVDDNTNEFDLAQLTFKNARVEAGKIHFLGAGEFDGGTPADPTTTPPTPAILPAPITPEPFGAGCNACHTNGGARAGFPAGGGNINLNTEVEIASKGIGESTVGVPLPHDEGASNSFPGGPPPFPGPAVFEEAFNVQSIIESAQKKAWFHNHRAKGDFEEAIAFYGSDDFVRAGGGPLAPVAGFATTLAGLKNGDCGPNTNGNCFPNGNGIEHLGAFLRSLNAYYNLRDCERLVKESLARMKKGVSSKNSQRHCEFNLNNARRVLKGIKLNNKPHQNVVNAVPFLVRQLDLAQKTKSKLIYKLALKEITKLKKSIATPSSTQMASAN